MELGVLQYIFNSAKLMPISVITHQVLVTALVSMHVHAQKRFSSIADMATKLEDNQIYGVVTISQTAETSK